MKPGDFVHNAEAGTPNVYIQYKGILDMDDLYASIADFFREKKFKLREKVQRLRKPGPIGTEVLYQFEATRDVEDYYQWKVDISIETFDMHDVEIVTKNGKKKKMTKGKIWIQLYGKIVTDQEKIWERSAFFAHLKSFYNKYVIRKKLEGVWWDELYYNIVLRLHALIKERLKMSSEGNQHRNFSRTH